ncbi:MAG TPA: hypothetical protein VE135_20700 [Pyrinomonadaceae bacterium]|nr:hypothetical protein [Pyrinomonadaceae bacterium]
MKRLVDRPKRKSRRRSLNSQAESSPARAMIVSGPTHEKKAGAKKLRAPLKQPRGNKQRFGLPKGFLSRGQRFGRSILLEGNIYRLPNGKEFVPRLPTGTLGTIGHLYALVTLEQYQNGQRSSVYVRSDGRIFDYAVDTVDPTREFFDTGYTMNDLERTGRYASKPG